MSTIIWIIVGAAAGLLLVYLLVMRVFFRQSRVLDKQIDYSKMRTWVDDDDKKN